MAHDLLRYEKSEDIVRALRKFAEKTYPDLLLM